VLIEVAACVLLVWRRRNPLLFATLSTAVLLAMPWVGPQLYEPSVPVMIWAVSIFALGRWLPDLRGLAGVALIVLLVFADDALVDPRQHSWSDVMFVAALIAAPYVLARVTRRLAEQNELLERQQEVIRRQAVRDERDRIAPEMHDVIAHSVSAIVVQTAAAQDLVRFDPSRAEQVLAGVADTGRHALAETGRLLHVLRDEHNELRLEPSPGLAGVGRLVEEFRASGLRVDLEVPDPLPVLPAVVDVSAYRIAQEALTNALKYGDRTGSLRLRVNADGLLIQASNPARTSAGNGSGLGLLGMAERVSLLGGSLAHGRTRDGRFELSVTLPAAAS
jgi:signal transduction histidine kinase